MKVAEIELVYKPRYVLDECINISRSDDVNDFAHSIWDHGTMDAFEEVKCIFLDRANNVKGVLNLSKGGISGSVVDIRIVCSSALKSLSTGVIVVHNHPSNKIKPSKSDIGITEKLLKALKFFDIKLLDHLIITSSRKYFSFADEKLII